MLARNKFSRITGILSQIGAPCDEKSQIPIASALVSESFLSPPSSGDYGFRKVPAKLKKRVGLFGVTVMGVGLIVGAGIYSVIGVAAGHAAESLWLSFLLASGVALLTGLSYCELATMFPSVGAEYIYLRSTFPKAKLPAFALGVLLILAGIATASTVALAFGGYLRAFIDLPPPITAAGVLTLAALVNSRGVSASLRANLVFTAIEVCGLLAVISLGFSGEIAPIAQPSFQISSGTWIATSLIFFVYLGFEEITHLVEETHHPSRNVPLAILVSLAVTTVLYLATALAVIRLLPMGELAASSFPLAAAVSRAGATWASALSVIALFSTANTVLITQLTISRMIYSMAREGDLPVALARVSLRSHSPWSAELLAWAIAVAFLFLGPLEELASLSSLTALLGFSVVNATLILLRYRKPKASRPFRVPGSIGRLPVIPTLALLFTVALLLAFPLRIHAIALALSALATLAYLLGGASRRA